MTSHLPAIEAAPVFDLDAEQIGATLRLIPAAATQVGHKSVQGHFRYGAPVTLEEEFVRDMFELSVPKMVEKWYGGAVNAGRFAAEVWGAGPVSRRNADPSAD